MKHAPKKTFFDKFGEYIVGFVALMVVLLLSMAILAVFSWAFPGHSPTGYVPPATNDGTGASQHGREAVVSFEFLMEIAKEQGAKVEGATFNISRAYRTELSAFDLFQCYQVQDWLVKPPASNMDYKIFDGLNYYCGGGNG